MLQTDFFEGHCLVGDFITSFIDDPVGSLSDFRNPLIPLNLLVCIVHYNKINDIGYCTTFKNSFDQNLIIELALTKASLLS